MAHLAVTLPQELALGAVESKDFATEVVVTDGGYEQRNARWSTPLRTFPNVSIPPARRDEPVYVALLALYEQALGNLHSFNVILWTDETESTTIACRFDGPLEIEAIAPHLDRVSFSLVEVRE